jgi:hypothetical protein
MASNEGVEKGVAYFFKPPHAIPFPKAASKSWQEFVVKEKHVDLSQHLGLFPVL